MRKVDARTQSNKQILKETADKMSNFKLVVSCRYLVGSLKPILPTGKEILGLFLALLMILQSNLYVFAAIRNSDEMQKRASVSELGRRQINSGNLAKPGDSSFENSNKTAFNNLPNPAKEMSTAENTGSQPFFFGEDSKLNSLLPGRVKNFFSNTNKELLKLIAPSENRKESFNEPKLPENPNPEKSAETVSPAENTLSLVDSVVAFGPKRFDRVNGPPNNYRETFSMPSNCVTGTYKLRVKNGEPNGTKRISSGFIKLNNAEIITQNDFNQNVYLIEKAVTLNSQNVLDIRLTSVPGSYLTIEVVGENCAPKLDTIPPSVIITAPTDNTATTADRITIRGTADDTGENASGILRVTVDGVQVPYNPTTKIWELVDKSLTAGSNAIIVKAVDHASNETTSQVVVIRDLTAPNITIISPTNNSVTQASAVTLSGTAVDAAADASGIARVTVNGTNAIFNPLDGQWSYPNLPLTIGANTINLKAVDNAGNETPLTITVNRQAIDSQAPTVSILSPTTNFTTFDNQIAVSGTATDEGDGASGVAGVLVNGAAANYNSANGQWSATVNLNTGINTITAIATDNATPPHQSQTQIQVTRLVTEVPALTITSPANGAFSSANSITVAGTVSSNNPNMALTATVNGQAASVTGGQFSQNIALNEGINTITVIARDALGQESQSSVTVTRDSTAPTVSLNVPANVQPGSSYQIQAEAADAYGVAEVEFLVDGVSLTRTMVAPYQFNYLVPADLPPNQTISISAVARDFSGASAVATAQTVTTGPSGIVGFVFDDVTGYILPEAVVALNGQNSVLTEGTGRYSFVSPTNAGFVTLSKNGYTTVERIYNSEAGLGVEVFDSRLTPLDSKTNVIEAGGGGTAISSNSRFSVQFANGSFPPSTDVRLTEVSPQGLANLLPFGWSPVPGAVVDIRPAAATITTTFPVPANLTVNQVAGVTAAIPLTLARYDEAQHKWIVAAKDIVVENGVLHAGLPAAGQYAFLVADTGATAPPSAVVGAALPSAAAASSDALSGATASANSSPRSAIYSQQAKSIITFEANSSSKLPSGVSVEATFDESYTLLLDRTTTFFGRPSQDFVLYSFPSANAETPNKLSAYFTAKPTRTEYGLADLLSAKIHVEIYTGRLAQSGVLIGTNGGTVSTDEGGQIEIPAGTTNQPQTVFFRRVAVNQTGITLPENYEIIAAFDFIQTGNNLTNSAKISFPSPSGDNSKIIVAKIINAGGQKLPKIIARAVPGDNSRIISTIAAPAVPNNVDLEGVISSGRYVFVRVPHAFGYVSGTVVRSGVPNGGNNVRVTSNREPFGDITGTNAKFVLLGTADPATASNTISGAALGSDATGQSTVNLSNQDDAAATVLNLSTVPLQIEAVTPANNAANVIVTAPITLTFNKPISGTTITGSNFKLTTASGNPVIANLTALAGGRSVVLTPASVLQGSTSYKVTVTQAVKDIYGNPMAGAFQSTFATANIVTAQQRLKPQNIRVAYPNAEGISTISIPAGSVPEGSVVTVINRTSGSTVSTVVGTQAIELQIQAQVGDELEIIIRQPDGIEYTIKQSAFRRDDGFYSVGANGGVVTSEDGTILLEIPASAITGQANIKISKALESEITTPRTGDMAPSEMAFAGGAKLEVSGDFTNNHELHLELDAPANAQDGQKVVFMSPKQIEEDGQSRAVWETITSGKIEAGKIKSTSPPFMGITLSEVQGNIGLLFFYCFYPARKFAVIGKVQKANPNGLPIPIDKATVSIVAQNGTSITATSQADGTFAVAAPSYTGTGDITITARTAAGVVAPPVVSYSYQSTAPALFGFETKYALIEYPAGSTVDQPANIQVEANTVNLPAGEIDPIRSGKAIQGSKINFRIKTTPSVELFSPKLYVNSIPSTPPSTRTRNQGFDIYEIQVNVDLLARYELKIETRTRASEPNTVSRASFGFVGLESPTTRPRLPGPPSVISVSPDNLAKQIDVGTVVHIEFSEPVTNLVAGQTVTLSEKGETTPNGENPPIPISGEITSNQLPVSATTQVSSIDFKPIQRLKGGKTYTVTVTNDVKDTDIGGNSQPAPNQLDQDPQTAGNQEFTSTFETFQGVILTDVPAEYNGFRIAAVEDLLVATKPNNGNGELQVFDTGVPETLTTLGDPGFISKYPIGLAVAKDVFPIYGTNQKIEKIAVVTTAPVPFDETNLDAPYTVQIFALDKLNNGNPKTAPKLIGIVTLSTPRAANETPVAVTITDKKAYIGGSPHGGVTVIDLEEAINIFAQNVFPDGKWYQPGSYIDAKKNEILIQATASRGAGFAKNTVKQKAPYKTSALTYAPVTGVSVIKQPLNNSLVPIAYIVPNQPQLISFNFDPSKNGILDFSDQNGDGSDDRVLIRKNLQPTQLMADLKAVSGVSIAAQTKDLVVAVGGNNFWVTDVTIPNIPNQYAAKTFLQLGLLATDQARQVEVEGTLAYVRFDNKVAVIDFSNPAAPYLSTVINYEGSALRWFAVSDGFIYTLDSNGKLKTGIGRGIIQAVVYGADPAAPDDICSSGVVIDRIARKPQQPAGFFIQAFGVQQVANNVKVKIRKVNLTGNTQQEQLIKTLEGVTLNQSSQYIAVGKALWEANTENFTIDENAIYTAEVILDDGKPTEIRSKKIEIPFSFLIPSFSDPVGFVSKGAEEPKTQTGRVSYLLTGKSTISVKINNGNIGSEIVKNATDDVYLRSSGLLNDEIKLTQNTPEGRYSLKFSAKLKANPNYTDEVEVFADVGNVKTDIRKPGSTVINGVEVGIGNLALSATDLMIKGRGLSLEVSRFYNSANKSGFNPLGYGWRHNYQVSLIKVLNQNGQIDYQLVGGEGSGQYFKIAKLYRGEIPAEEPYQGTLVPNQNGSFDYFTKQRIKYHFDIALDQDSPSFYMGNLSYIEEPNGNRVTLTYDSYGRLSQVKDSSERKLTYAYELAETPFAGAELSETTGENCGKRNRLKELLDRIDQATIGKAWRVTEIKSADGIKIKYEYDDKGNLEFARRDGSDTIGSQPTADSVWQYAYNPSPTQDDKYRHLIKSASSPNHGLAGGVGGTTLNRKTVYEYDLTRLDMTPVTKITMPEGVTNTFFNTYRPGTAGVSQIDKTVVTDGNHNETTYNFDAFQRMISAILPRGGTQAFVWTRFGQLQQTTDAEGVTTTYGFDLHNNQISTKIEGGEKRITTITEYDQFYNKPTKTIDANNQTTIYRLDAKGNVYSVELPTGRTVTINYYPNGDVLDTTDQYGFVTRYPLYDNYGNPKIIKKEAGSQTVITNNTYDVRSRLKTTNDTLASSIAFNYDALDRVVSQTITDPTGFQDQGQMTAEYLPEGQPLSVEQTGEAQSYRTESKYDGLNRLRQTTETVSDYGSITRNFSYDYNSNLITSQDRRGITTTNSYDALNFLTKVQLSGGVGGTRTVWDASSADDIDLVGNVKQFKDLYGNVTIQKYDEIHRLKERNVQGFAAEKFDYDDNGNLILQVDRNDHATIIEYDSLNRQKKTTDAEGRQIITEYKDSEKKVVRKLIPQGLVETTTFDALQRPTVREVKLAAESSAYRTEFTYENRTVRIKDPRGITTVKELSAAGQEANVSVDSAAPAFATQTRYKAFGAVKSYKDANGREFTFTVDGFNRTKSADYDGEFSESWEFDGEGLLLSHTDKRGAVSVTGFDNLKRAIETNVTKDGSTIRVQKLEYFDNESKVVIKDANNHSTTQIYDGLRRVTTITNALGDSRTLTYDGENLRTETDWFNSEEKQTKYEYDKINRPRKITQRPGSGGQSRLTDISYNDTGGLTKTTTDRRGNKQKEVFDGLGRTKGVYVSPALGAEATERVAEFSYDGNSNRTATTDGMGNVTNYVYDKLNRVQFVNHAGNLQVEGYTYEANGNIATYSDGRGGAESYLYDTLDRVKSARDGAGNETKFKYDGEGLLLEKTEPKGASYRTSYAYNALGSLKSVTDADNKTWNFTYDAAQNLDTVTDPLQRTVDYDYDSLDRLTKVTQPLGLVTSYNEYDKNSNLKRMTDPKGQIVDYTYDELDRVKKTVYKNAQIGGEQLSFEYNYDAEDNVTEVKETNSINQIKNYSRKYDARNRLTEEKDSRQNIVNFAYDATSNVKQITARNYYNATQTTKETNYTYDALNRLDTVSAGSTPVAKYNWTADGLLDEVTYQGNASTKRKFSYDNADRVANITNTIGTNTESFDYGYDANSNRTSETRKFNAATTRTITNTFDMLDRLATSSSIAPPTDRTPPPINSSRQIFEYKRTFAYEYDAVGNREKETTQNTTTTITLTTNGQGTTTEARSDAAAPAEVTTAEFDDVNRLTRTTKGSTVKTFEYDNNGNLTVERVGGQAVRSYEYDNRNQLTKIKGAASEEIVRYDYDFERRRLTKFIQGAEIDYSYAGNQVVAEYNGNSLLNSYTLGANEVVKSQLSNEGERFYYSDALGSTTSLASGSTLTSRTEYGSFGEIIGSSGATYNAVGYTGQRLDPESGLMPLGNGERYYSPELARFIQQDSFAGMIQSAQSMNRYAYVVNNPLKHTDPSGHIAPVILYGLYLLIAAGAFYTGVRAVEEEKIVEKRNAEQIKQGVDPASLPNPTLTAVANNSPIIGPAFRAISGQDPVTGEDLSTGWRVANGAFAVLDVLPFTKTGNKIFSKIGEGGAKVIGWLGRNGRKTEEALEVVPKAVRLFEENADELGNSSKSLDNVRKQLGNLDFDDIAQQQKVTEDLFRNRRIEQLDDLKNSGQPLGMTDDFIETASTRGGPIPGDADFIGPLKVKGKWRIIEKGEGAHLVEKSNIKGRSELSAFHDADTPRFYPNGNADNGGYAHLRLHAATRAEGVSLGRSSHLTDVQLLVKYQRAYSRNELTNIKGTLRTPNSSAILGTNLTPEEAYKELLKWYIQRRTGETFP